MTEATSMYQHSIYDMSLSRSFVRYECSPNMRRTDDYNLTEFDATCDENGQFPQLLSWPSCANGDNFFYIAQKLVGETYFFSDILC